MSFLLEIIMAFFGGVFGAYVGSIASFVFCGALGLIGVGIYVATGNMDFITNVALGPVFTPQIAFAGGVAAASYYGMKSRKKLVPADMVLPGNNIVAPLATTGDFPTLLVGGAFAMLSQALCILLKNYAPLKVDSPALALIIVAFIGRLVFDDSGVLGKNFKLSERLNYNLNQTAFHLLAAYAIALGMTYFTKITGVSTFGFLLGGLVLAFGIFGVPIPANHHVSMVAAFAFGVIPNIWIAAIFGPLAWLTADLLARLFNTDVESHIDPPAFTIALFSLILLNI